LYIETTDALPVTLLILSSLAINIFFHQSVLQGGLPFEVKNYKKADYFAELHQSIEQLEQGKIVIKTIDELEEMEN
jgi:antitoxin component of RelBE/YafQ-DinJ toxin-antitoxin module